jgi:hypothetical protein
MAATKVWVGKLPGMKLPYMHDPFLYVSNLREGRSAEQTGKAQQRRC